MTDRSIFVRLSDRLWLLRDFYREYKDDTETFWKHFPAQRNTVLGVVVLVAVGAFWVGVAL